MDVGIKNSTVFTGILSLYKDVEFLGISIMRIYPSSACSFLFCIFWAVCRHLFGKNSNLPASTGAQGCWQSCLNVEYFSQKGNER